ncbi:uncharacterized protein LOC144715829 [Wolffia australiana]
MREKKDSTNERKRMKRKRTEGGEEQLLMLFSGGEEMPHVPRQGGRLFGCKTCNRQFASFQALGGHRASHRKPRLPGEKIAALGKPKLHECPICELEFSMGQALGGHMRRHRAAAESFARRCAEIKRGGDVGCGDSVCLDLDLNTFHSPKNPDSHPLNLRLSLGLSLSLVDCFH